MTRFRLGTYFWSGAVLLAMLWPHLSAVKRPPATTAGVVQHWDWFRGRESAWLINEITLFEESHPGLKVNRTNLPEWQRYREILAAALQTGKSVDVFYIPRRVSLLDLVRRGWIRPLKGYLDTPAWRARYFSGALRGSEMEGELYSFPIEAPAARVRVLFVNRGVFEKLGISSAHRPLPALETWEDLIHAARQVASAGVVHQPPTYGFGLGARGASQSFSFWLDLAAAAGGFYYMGGLDGFDPRRGRFEYSTNPAYAGAINVLLTLKRTGALQPGAMTLTQEDALKGLLEGRFAMTFGTLDDLRRMAEWRPGLAGIEVRPLPRPDPNMRFSWLHMGPGRTFHLASTGSPAGAEWLRWLSSTAVAKRWLEAGLGPVVFPIEGFRTSSAMGQAYEQFLAIAVKETCQAPDPARLHPDFGKLRIRPVSPDVVDVVEGALLGRLDLGPALSQLDEQKKRALERALRELQDEGSGFKLEHLTFPDWTPVAER